MNLYYLSVIWFDILYVVNMVSKKIHAKNMQIDTAMTEVSGLISYLRKYKETGFVEAMMKANEIANEFGIEPIFFNNVLFLKNSLMKLVIMKLYCL